MLEQKGIEELLIIDKESVDFDHVSIDKLKRHVLRINNEMNVSFITVKKIAVADKETVDFFTGELLPQSSPSAPNVLTFVEARFWVMCGVKFKGIAAMVSYDSIELRWDETSHVIENGIRLYAKAVGAGMRASTTECFQITRSMEKAYEFAELVANDQNLDKTRVKIRIIGTQRIQAVIQLFLLPNSLELATDGVYCLSEEGLDYERLLMPHFVIKNCGYIPNSFYTPSLCGLKVKVDALSTNPQTLDFENIDELKTLFKLRNYDLLGPLEARSGKPTIMTGAAGSGKQLFWPWELRR
ncbi:hypothetical protein T492DRAFT_840408 [Pavlovales sp. CCMP2436]|nr:hypothetical protein T492DRAFT_840408 [Pavlovales sp. CCMP2436]